jgi:hypothetical protein
VGFRKSVVKEGRRRVGCQRLESIGAKILPAKFECWSASCPSGSIFEKRVPVFVQGPCLWDPSSVE